MNTRYHQVQALAALATLLADNLRAGRLWPDEERDAVAMIKQLARDL